MQKNNIRPQSRKRSVLVLSVRIREGSGNIRSVEDRHSRFVASRCRPFLNCRQRDFAIKSFHDGPAIAHFLNSWKLNTLDNRG